MDVRQIVQLRDQFGFAVIFITHDMSLLLEIADRIAIMYAGKIIEDGGSQESAALRPNRDSLNTRT